MQFSGGERTTDVAIDRGSVLNGDSPEDLITGIRQHDVSAATGILLGRLSLSAPPPEEALIGAVTLAEGALRWSVGRVSR
jgi:hypothetical protein